MRKNLFGNPERRRSRHAATLIRCLLPSLLLVATGLGSVSAQTFAGGNNHPRVQRGFVPEGMYQFDNVDSVNLFNGNLVATIPIGSSYPVGPEFSYQLNLVYNSKLWVFESPQSDPGKRYAQAHPIFNAGLGWRLSLGEYKSERDWPSNNNVVRYRSADGAEHKFYGSSTSQTKDGSFLRHKTVNGKSQIEFPDGSRHTFGNSGHALGEVVEMRDYYGNRVDVQHFSSRYEIRDFAGQNPGASGNPTRLHNVYFRTINNFKVIDRVVLESFGGGSATYQFHYRDANGTAVGRPCGDENPNASTIRVPLLERVTLAGSGTEWSMTYNIPQNAQKCNEGTMATLTLPTRGEIAWDFNTVPIPPPCNPSTTSPPSPNPFPFDGGAGVFERTFTDNNGNILGKWRYGHHILNYGGVGGTECGVDDTSGLTKMTEVITPLLDKELHYFTIYDAAANLPGGVTGAGADQREYGLPFDRAQPDPVDNVNPAYAERFLSREIFDCNEPNPGSPAWTQNPVCPSQPTRSIYVGYEMDAGTSCQNFTSSCTHHNRRLAAERTVYHNDSDRYTGTNYTSWNGMGNYRYNRSIDSFPNTANFTSYTRYTSKPGNSDPWFLNGYTYKWSRHRGTEHRVDTCFETVGNNRATPKLLRKRVRKAVGYNNAPTPQDSLVVYQYDSKGFVNLEKHHGGDDNNSGNTGLDLCTVSPVGQTHQFAYENEHGVLSRGYFENLNGTQAAGDAYDYTIDQSTGLVESSRNISGQQTDYTYDDLGRPTRIDPFEDESTIISYAPPTGSKGLEVTVRVGPSGTPFARSQVELDGFGRKRFEEEDLPNNGRSVRRMSYDAMGNMIESSELHPTRAITDSTKFLEYDPFGRARRIRPSSSYYAGAEWQDEIRHLYIGARVKRTTTQIATTSNAANGAPGQEVTRSEIYDQRGRLIEACDVYNNGCPTSSTKATYEYDAGDNLTEVRLSSGGTNQYRYFTYDGRGLLASETHPESGTAHYRYGALGQVLGKTDAERELFNTYDSANRLRLVEQVQRNGSGAITNRWNVERYVYYSRTSGNLLHRNKLSTSARYNYPFGLAGGANEVREVHTYVGQGGRRSKLRTLFYDPSGQLQEDFLQLWYYDTAGNVTLRYYPKCRQANCNGADDDPAVDDYRRVDYSYDHGFLEGIGKSNNPIVYASLFYHPNKQLSAINHGNGVQDLFDEGDNRIARPKRIRVSKGASTHWDSGPYQYDGTGNVTRIGNPNGLFFDRFIYDTRNRLAKSLVIDSSTFSSADQTYSYDGFGNLDMIEDNAGSQYGVVVPHSTSTNRLTGGNVSYDGVGNITTWNGNTYEWGPRGEMTRMTTPQKDVVHLYNASGERVMTFFLGESKSRWTFRDEEGRLVRELEANITSSVADGVTWTVKRDYVYAGSRLISIETPGGPKTVSTDHLGTPRIMTNAGGNVVARHTYTPFGIEITPLGQDLERIKFTGHERDLFGTTATGDDIDYMHARYYQAQVGRFLSVDPARDSFSATSPSSWNRYTYAANNPARFVDPSGEIIESGWDVLNLGLGARSLYSNLREGRFGSAALDTVGLIIDGIATAVPGGSWGCCHLPLGQASCRLCRARRPRSRVRERCTPVSWHGKEQQELLTHFESPRHDT